MLNYFLGVDLLSILSETPSNTPWQQPLSAESLARAGLSGGAPGLWERSRSRRGKGRDASLVCQEPRLLHSIGGCGEEDHGEEGHGQPRRVGGQLQSPRKDRVSGWVWARRSQQTQPEKCIFENSRGADEVSEGKECQTWFLSSERE